jgi:isochorismate pyruvate lyase
VSLDDIRARIDDIDNDLVKLLARRQQLVQQAGTHKTTDDAVRAPERRARVIARAEENARRHGLAPSVAGAVYTAMFDAFIELELDVARTHRSQQH